jgi:hypothetical protein
MQKTIQAKAHIRKMRGGAQAHLIESTDGDYYVVKFRDNPQHRRILINEVVTAALLRSLKIRTPQTAVIRVETNLIRRSPGLYFELGSTREPVKPGLHFGSKYPVDPLRTAVFDFIPDTMLGMVGNLADFRGVLAVDKWVSNMDARQAIFCRRSTMKDPSSGTPGTKRYVAFMIDNGLAFNGAHWSYVNSAVQGLYSRKGVYGSVRGIDSFEPWLNQIATYPETLIDQAARLVPPEWFEDDIDDLERLLDNLFKRRRHVADLLYACCHANCWIAAR